MKQHTPRTFPTTIGLDLGSRSTQVAVFDRMGGRVEERKISTTKDSLEQLFGRFPGARVVMEASTPTRWINNFAKDLGHEVIIANPRKIPVITKNIRKSDRNDARLLGELGQLKPELLSPIELRDDIHQLVRTRLFAREQLVKSRSSLCTFVRSQVKSTGHKLPSGSTRTFALKMRPALPAELADVLEPILRTIQHLSDEIDGLDQQLKIESTNNFPHTALLRQVNGVGPLISLAFVVTVGTPERFKDSRSVGAYFGLVPRLDQSGESDPELKISRHGDAYMRSLLVSAATRILGPFGEDSDLRRFGLKIAERGGRKARSKARIAVARKLAVLLHRLLVTGEAYEPLRNAGPVRTEADAA
ncbi:MAG: IS110 family transposase [Planctomycetota bacterium]